MKSMLMGHEHTLYEQSRSAYSLQVIIPMLQIFKPNESNIPGLMNKFINLPKTLVLKEFIKIISEKTGTVFVYEEKNLRGQMSITAPRNFKVSQEDAFFFFVCILTTILCQNTDSAF